MVKNLNFQCYNILFAKNTVSLSSLLTIMHLLLQDLQTHFMSCVSESLILTNLLHHSGCRDWLSPA